MGPTCGKHICTTAQQQQQQLSAASWQASSASWTATPAGATRHIWNGLVDWPPCMAIQKENRQLWIARQSLFLVVQARVQLDLTCNHSSSLPMIYAREKKKKKKKKKISVVNTPLKKKKKKKK